MSRCRRSLQRPNAPYRSFNRCGHRLAAAARYIRRWLSLRRTQLRSQGLRRQLHQAQAARARRAKAHWAKRAGHQSRLRPSLLCRCHLGRGIETSRFRHGRCRSSPPERVHPPPGQHLLGHGSRFHRSSPRLDQDLHRRAHHLHLGWGRRVLHLRCHNHRRSALLLRKRLNQDLHNRQRMLWRRVLARPHLADPTRDQALGQTPAQVSVRLCRAHRYRPVPLPLARPLRRVLRLRRRPVPGLADSRWPANPPLGPLFHRGQI